MLSGLACAAAALAILPTVAARNSNGELAEPGPAPAQKATPTPLRIVVAGAGGASPKHPTVAYHVSCSASCSGQISARALLVKHRGSAHGTALHALDFGPVSLSITATAGGTKRFTLRYGGRALRTLKAILRQGEAVELRLSVSATDGSGARTQALGIVWLEHYY